MHGRLKVRTSAEEAARKKKEQDLKAKAYRIGMDKIFSLRSSESFGSELLELTGKILSVNPDLSTLWNIRRECILKMTEENKEDSTLFDRDLGFTELCLQIQPKSYGAWHHRSWILENSPKPDWDKEVNLCKLYLKKDERNFHCWDYRRYVVKKANVSAEKEFEFCDDKIQKNFSNYSSWFYRSQLLPILHPHESDQSRPISEEKLKEELEIVITAAFTDPNDSSAWFYQRYLLGYSDPKFDIACFKLIKQHMIIAFTKAVDLNRDKISIFIDNNCDSQWMAISGNKSDCIWINRGDFEITDEILIKVTHADQEYSLTAKKYDKSAVIGCKLPSFGYEFGIAVKEELKNQLESCNQLLEFEPDSKFTLLTAALLMRSLDRFHYHEETLEYLKKLQTVDPLRYGYYRDLASKWILEVKLKEFVESGKYEKIDLTALDLTTVYYNQFLVIANEIDLRENPALNKNSCKFSLVEGCNVSF
ncbi:unnamed protein product [Chironomus riparius]|uniref:Geranylgeranyl transferase type-2 subunit alpha n=1 Tax=Chironomus riparius TaxID=315576 RepID=A0A9N9WL59_9DIPT|nr:unnamed protein product [Chironomus riparius]